MHVLIVSQIFPPDMGGSATRALNIAKSLLSRGHQITVIAAFPHYPTGNIPKKYRQKALAVEYLGKIRVIRTYVPPLASKGLARRLVLFGAFTISSLFAVSLVRKVNVVFASNPQILSVFPGFFYGLVNSCAVVQNVDDLWPEVLYDLNMVKSRFFRRIAEIIARLTYRASTAITPISPSYVDTIVEKYGIDPRKVHVVPGGVDLSIFSCQNQDESSRAEFRALYIGAFSLGYDFEQVLRAAKLLAEEKNVEIVLQGGGELAPFLKSRVKEMSLSNVRIIDRVVDRDEVVRTMAAADCLLLPLSGFGSIEKGISSKLYEYQAAGKPIICCSDGQPGRYTLDTRSGVVVKPGDYVALAKAILFLRDNPKVAEQFKISGREYVKANLSIEKIGLKIERIVSQAILNKH